MAQQPTYILAPNFHFKPGTGPIALGNIISHPLRPHRALTTVDTETLAKIYPRVETFTDHDWSMNRGDSRDISISIWAEFLQTASGMVSGGRGSEVQSNYKIDSLQTMYFVEDPSLEEIQRRLKTPRVQSVMKATRMPGFRTPVYMVTGLMVAQGFSANLEKRKSHENGVDLSGNAPSPIGQVGAGVNLDSSKSHEETHGWRAGEDFVFAYQLLKIEAKGWKGDKIRYDEFQHKAAYLSRDSDEDSDNESDEDDIEELLISPAITENFQGDDMIGSVNVADIREGDTKVQCVSATQS